MSKLAQNKNLWASMPVILALSRYDRLEEIADHLTVNRTTVVRQLSKLEEEVGAKLFNRSQGKISLTSTGKEFVKLVEMFEVNMSQLPAMQQVGDDDVSGAIRIAIAPHICQIIAPMINEMALKFPSAEFEILSSYGFQGLGYRESDIAIRISRTPPDPPLYGKQLLKLEGAMFESIGAVKPQVGVIRREEAPIPENAHFSSHVASMIYTDDIIVKQELIAAGGIGRLPCWIGDSDPRLKRASNLLPNAGWKLWLIGHSAYRNTKKNELISEHIISQIRSSQ